VWAVEVLVWQCRNSFKRVWEEIYYWLGVDWKAESCSFIDNRTAGSFQQDGMTGEWKAGGSKCWDLPCSHRPIPDPGVKLLPNSLQGKIRDIFPSYFHLSPAQELLPTWKINSLAWILR
jgi:hypothetical protein